ncbi:hypothetical protein N7U49_47855 (plasmid) [Streptomyces sp. AD2-2]|nr:hypothetical protein N7U49_47855 [Streptomyces sp. AD2-2]
MSGGELSGIDLARVARGAAPETERKNGGSTRSAKPKPRTTSVVRHDGREPVGLGAAIGAPVIERAWELPATGVRCADRERAAVGVNGAGMAGLQCADQRRKGNMCFIFGVVDTVRALDGWMPVSGGAAVRWGYGRP